jgi:hypothetical protein
MHLLEFHVNVTKNRPCPQFHIRCNDIPLPTCVSTTHDRLIIIHPNASNHLFHLLHTTRAERQANPRERDNARRTRTYVIVKDLAQMCRITPKKKHREIFPKLVPIRDLDDQSEPQLELPFARHKRA